MCKLLTLPSKTTVLIEICFVEIISLIVLAQGQLIHNIYYNIIYWSVIDIYDYTIKSVPNIFLLYISLTHLFMCIV